MPDLETAAQSASADPPPAMHPMDPARGATLSPAFGALLSWLTSRPAMTEPAITGVVVTGQCVFAATTHSPFHDTLIGSWADVEANIRAWGSACDTEPAIVDGLLDKLRRASR